MKMMSECLNTTTTAHLCTFAVAKLIEPSIDARNGSCYDD